MGIRFFSLFLLCTLICAQAQAFIFGGRRYRYRSYNNNPSYQRNQNNQESRGGHEGTAGNSSAQDREAKRNERKKAEDVERAAGEALRDKIKKVAEAAGPTFNADILDPELISKAKCVRFVDFPNRVVGPFAGRDTSHSDVQLFEAMIFARKGAQLESVVAATPGSLAGVSKEKLKEYRERHLDPISKPGATFVKANETEKGLEFNCAPRPENNWRRSCSRTVRKVTVNNPETGKLETKYLIHQKSENRYDLTDFRNVHHFEETWCL